MPEVPMPMDRDALAEVPTPMFLYELAIELDKRSADLIDDARRLGLTEMSASALLTPDQVASLRGANGVAPVAGPGPVTWGPPGPAGGSPPSAPPPPVPPPTRLPPPATWGPPPVEGEDRPTFIPASGSMIASPANSAPPPSPPPAASGQGPGPAGPVNNIEPPAKGRVGQIAVIAVVVAAVAGLFVYMAANSGPDKARQHRLAEANRLDDQRPPATLAPTTTAVTVPSTETTLAPSEQPGAQYIFADQAKYCEGARGITAFELRIVAGESERDWQRSRRDTLDGRAAWRGAVDSMILGASPILQPDLLTYRDGYTAMIDRVSGAGTDAEIMAAYLTANVDEMHQASTRINRATQRTCR